APNHQTLGPGPSRIRSEHKKSRAPVWGTDARARTSYALFGGWYVHQVPRLTIRYGGERTCLLSVKEPTRCVGRLQKGRIGASATAPNRTGTPCGAGSERRRQPFPFQHLSERTEARAQRSHRSVECRGASPAYARFMTP